MAPTKISRIKNGNRKHKHFNFVGSATKRQSGKSRLMLDDELLVAHQASPIHCNVDEPLSDDDGYQLDDSELSTDEED